MDMNLKISVTRPVYEKACKLEDAANRREDNLTDWNLAEWLRDTFTEIGLNEDAEFWHEVYLYLMSLECSDAGTEVEINDAGAG